ncbi:SgcJ/EcaC family oxidoreductase [Kibdelosporangium philippinense]|uniref:SgcJ/EcaC family oxidoreductase n=1 Tax=Kibdelosporangium philippinense TaxID=211113 RepID=A0ABS8ZDK3_9PSEU|nr:SgcJ/EcaC family oxidoreductase [Kibdelosporangium philippinense]MCE7004751.1 SgcJ/EcaC family oxidoreductase [Kibdelosporangium philippinense]
MTEQQISALWDRMSEGWAAGDAQAFASVFDPDVEFVTVRGDEHHGREAVAASHAALFTSVYAGTLLKPEVRLVRALAEGIYLVHAVTTVYPAGITTHAQAIVRRGGHAGWSIVAFHNMIPGGSR